MKRQLLLSLFFVTFVPNVGVACTLNLCEAHTGAYGGYTDISNMPVDSCLSEEILCGECNGQKIKVRNCRVCDAAKYELYEATATISGNVTATVKYNACRLKTAEQPECDNCGGECRGEYYVPVTGQPGYQSIFNETCYSLECKCLNMPTLKYKCAPGYRQVDEEVEVSCNPEGCKGCEICSATDEAYGADKKKQCLHGDWGHYSEGYEYRDYANFIAEDCSCEFTKEYRCAAGWYGLASYNFLTKRVGGCSQCLTVGNIFMDKNLKEKARGTSTAGNNLKKDSCYLPTDTYYMKSGTVKIENKVSSMCTY